MIAQRDRFRTATRRFARMLATAAAVVLATFWMVQAAAAQAPAKRVALVIGNSEYAHLPRLKNPTNDVREVVAVLRSAQFEVIYGRDLTRVQFEELVKTFLRSVESADVSLIYYSGHGVHVADHNYLIPIDAKLSTPYDVEIETIRVDNIYRYIRETTKVQLIFLDACRDNPFNAEQYWIADRLERAAGNRGLARPASTSSPAGALSGNGSLFAFSTEPRQVAYDGSGDLSHYTQAFVRRALTPNLELRQMLTQVRRDVITATNGQQRPWENSSLVDDFFMLRLPGAPSTAAIHRLNIVAGSGGAPIDLPTPRSPSGAPLTIAFDRIPETGRLLVDGRPVQAGSPIPAARLPHLTFDPGAAPAGHVELLTYAVSDPWKQSSQGAIAVSVTEAAQMARSSATRLAQQTRPVAPPPRHQEAHAYVASLQRLSPEAPIGVGPVPLRLPEVRVPPGGETLNVTVNEVPATGMLRAGDRVVEAGSTLPLAEIASLTFEPQIGTQGRTQSFRLTFDTGERRTASGFAARPVIHPCDTAAAEPFDLQGVAPGRLPNEIDPPAALRACGEAMRQYPAIARFEFQLGRAHLAARAVAEGWRHAEAAADRGHVRALYQIGYLNRLGVGRPASEAAAVEMFKRGADRGDPYSIYDYGKALFYGRGVDKDVGNGLAMMLRAADLGHTYAMNELGYIFTSGSGMTADTERGMRFYQAGVERRDIYSFNNVGVAYLRGTGVPRDVRKAMDYFVRAASGGHPYAPTNVARLYRDGAGVPRNEALAATWFERGAERGDYWGAFDRGRLALQGAGRLRNNVDAGYYFALATALNRPGVGDPDNNARQLLHRLPEDDKRKVEQRLLRQLTGADAAAVSAASLEDRLVALARRSWEQRNPRIDLF
ncbi:caspase family protein [Phreatobacter stygius]|uniref:Peptidase n=1 Tax=Phreatobacter stygius TaxID=1940610 RepID=A0A4D7AW11_9HYPH|nr:caspase family protein [Phreatobacter stygius]QCI64061.1 peptidase [Phreatobacter stygius]